MVVDKEERDHVRPPTLRSRQAGRVCSAEGWGGICGTHVHVLASGIFVCFVCVGYHTIGFTKGQNGGGPRIKREDEGGGR